MIAIMSAGIYRIFNLKTDETFLGKCQNTDSVCASERFKLDLGLHPCQSLQKDYSETGLELFTIEVMKECAHEDLDTEYESMRKGMLTSGVSFYPA